MVARSDHLFSAPTDFLGNDDLPSLGGETPLDVALTEGAAIGYRGFEQSWNEFAWAHLVAEHFGTVHHDVAIDADDFWRAVPEVVRHQDEVASGPVSVPLYVVYNSQPGSGDPLVLPQLLTAGVVHDAFSALQDRDLN